MSRPERAGLPVGNIVGKLVSFRVKPTNERPGSSKDAEVSPPVYHNTSEYPIGIDLGTKHCCVAVSVKNEIRVLRNESDKNTTPSYVSFEENGCINIGEAAKDRSWKNPNYTIYDTKRMIGRDFLDKDVQRAMKDWLFTVKVSKHNKPMIQTRDGFKLPEEISALLIHHCVTMANKYLRAKVTKAVITIPAYFNDLQRSATLQAGKLAGLEEIALLTEPTAAIIAYRLNKVEEDGKRKVVVFDLGAGTFDIAITDIDGGDIVILGTGGDSFLGGDDFDQQLVDYSIAEFNKTYKVDIRDRRANKNFLKSLALIREQCEKQKIVLSKTEEAEIIVPYVYNDLDMQVTVTREKFEALIQPYVDRMMCILVDMLAECKVDKSDIDDIVLVGEPTRTPKIQNALKNFFNNKVLNEAINPDDAVAYGAAVHAASLFSSEPKKSIDIRLVETLSISYGVKAIIGGKSDQFSPIIKKGTRYPAEASMEFQTSEDYQEEALITIYQGDSSPDLSDKVMIGTFKLSNIPPRRAGEEVITVFMKLDLNGILRVTAKSTSKLVKKEIVVRRCQ